MSVGGFFDLVVHVRRDEAREQIVEGFVVVDPDAPLAAFVVFVDVDLGEERLVEQSPGLVVGLQVRRVAVAGEVEGVGQHGAGILVVGVGRSQALLDSGELTGDSLLLCLEQVKGDRAGVVRIKELLALGGKRDPLLSHLRAFGGGGGLQVVEVGEDECFDVVAEFGGERDGAVLVLDEFLDQLHLHGLPPAIGDLPAAS